MSQSRIVARSLLAAFTFLLAGVLYAAPALAQSESKEGSDANVDALASQLSGKSGIGLTSLQLSGFADASFVKYNFKNKAMASTFGDQGSFFVGNLNLYLDAQLSQRARSLIEVRFTYLPNGNPDRDSTTNDTTRRVYAAMDYNDLYRNRTLGSIIIERAWVEYRLDELLTLRAGHFLTPYGIWNVDHGSPAIVGVLRPFIIGQQFMPESQVGLEGYGVYHINPSTLLGYHLTLTNGRIGNHAQYVAVNGKPGFGGRVFVESNALGELRVGASGYSGGYQDYSYKFDAATFGSDKVVSQKFDEYSIAADAHWAWKDLLVNAEYVTNTMKYKVGNPMHLDGLTQVTGDRRWGTYVLAGYKLPFCRQVMPFVMHEFIRSSEQLHKEGFNSDFTHYPAGVLDIYKWTLGLNYHVQPNLVVKAQYGMVEHRGPNVFGMGDNSSEWFVQTAWAF